MHLATGKMETDGTYFREWSYSTLKDVQSHTKGVLLANPIIDKRFPTGLVLLTLTVLAYARAHTRAQL